MSSDSFTCFLHQNCPPFYTDIQDFALMAEAFSEADLLLRCLALIRHSRLERTESQLFNIPVSPRDWGTTGKMNVSDYGGSIAARAVMFHNTKPAQGLGARKFSAPEYFPANRTSRLRQAALSASFPSLPSRELVTSTAPLLARLAPANLGPAQMAAIRDVASFPLRGHFARQVVHIGQGDVFQEEEEDEEVLLDKASDPEVTVPEAVENDDQEEMVIEDFDEDPFFGEEDFGEF